MPPLNLGNHHIEMLIVMQSPLNMSKTGGNLNPKPDAEEKALSAVQELSQRRIHRLQQHASSGSRVYRF